MSESEQFIYRKLEQVKEAGVIVSIISRLKIKKKTSKKAKDTTGKTGLPLPNSSKQLLVFKTHFFRIQALWF